MARIRTIKPEFPQSESMGNVSRDARLTFVLMWTIADDSGRLRANSRMLASLLFPYDDDAGKKIDGWIGELEMQHCVIRYEHDGAQYIQIEKWSEHQRIDRPSPSRFPSFDESSRILASNTRTICVGKEGIKEGKGEDQRKGHMSDFENLWDIYPRKDGSKQKAMEFYLKAIKSGVEHGRIESGVRAYAESIRREGTEKRYIAHAATWLNQRRWEADYSAKGGETEGKSKWAAAAEEYISSHPS